MNCAHSPTCVERTAWIWYVTDADPARDEGRNLVASPTAGIDRSELLDTRPLASSLERRLRRAGRGWGLR